MNTKNIFKNVLNLSAVLCTGCLLPADISSNSNNTIQKRMLGSNLEVSPLGLGCMSMSGIYNEAKNPKDMAKVISEAIDLGITHFDTAELYGDAENEIIVGNALKNKRHQVTIATKFGIDLINGQQIQNSRPERIRKAVEGSLKRLNTDYIDLYFQHRVDTNIPIEDMAGVMKDLIKEGKILNWGLSEPGLETLKRAHKELPIAAIENQYSIISREVEVHLLDLLDELNIGLTPWAPLERAFLTGIHTKDTKFEKNDARYELPRFTSAAMENNYKVAELLIETAKSKNATPAQIALAWLLHKRSYIVPIPGTTNIEHLKENAGALNVKFSKAELEEFNKHLYSINILGSRYVPNSSNETRAGAEAPLKN